MLLHGLQILHRIARFSGERLGLGEFLAKLVLGCFERSHGILGILRGGRGILVHDRAADLLHFLDGSLHILGRGGGILRQALGQLITLAREVALLVFVGGRVALGSRGVLGDLLLIFDEPIQFLIPSFIQVRAPAFATS